MLQLSCDAAEAVSTHHGACYGHAMPGYIRYPVRLDWFLSTSSLCYICVMSYCWKACCVGDIFICPRRVVRDANTVPSYMHNGILVFSICSASSIYSARINCLRSLSTCWRKQYSGAFSAWDHPVTCSNFPPRHI